MQVSAVEGWVFRVPIERPVRTSFGMMTDRPALLLRIWASDGAWGWGEVFCNFPSVGAEHRARLLSSVVAPLLQGARSDDPSRVHARLESQLRTLVLQCGEPGPFAQVLAGVDQALWDMAARRAGMPLWQYLAEPGGQARVRLYASGLGPGDVAATAMRKRDEGYRAFKFKVGFDPLRDLANFREIREVLGADAVIMIDANQAWSSGEAVARIRDLAPFSPLWVEEPIPADEPASAWHEVARDGGVALAAGENLRGLGPFADALASGHLAFVQPDVAKWGGISGCLKVAKLARRVGVTFCPHWLGGGIGLAASLHLRAALGPDGYAEVDSNPNPLRDQLCPLVPHEGWVRLPEMPGHGVEPDLARLAHWRVPG
jgi:L-alanine-DL-glutamate epimerase-like enolase superfamily enzyme